jgi:hypothetical protein
MNNLTGYQNTLNSGYNATNSQYSAMYKYLFIKFKLFLVIVKTIKCYIHLKEIFQFNKQVNILVVKLQINQNMNKVIFKNHHLIN